MTFRISGLDPAPFLSLYGLPDGDLADRGVIRRAVDDMPGFPDRIGLVDVPVGETALLLNYEHLAVASPYRSRHAIYVREGATEAASFDCHVPDVLARRVLSLRGIDAAGHIVEADLAEGARIAEVIGTLLADPQVAYVHAHFAKRGCFAARIDRL